MTPAKIVKPGTGVRTSFRCTADRHGTAPAYRDGCRCPEGREAWRLYNKRRRENRNQPGVIDGTGTRRRLQALVAIGWAAPEMARRLGVGQAVITRLYQQQRVNGKTAAAVRQLYDSLWSTPGPSWRSRYRAQASGWPPPQAWDDDEIDDPTARSRQGRLPTGKSRDDLNEVAVTAACNGKRGNGLTIADRREIVRRLHAQGLTDPEIQALTGIHKRTALRIRGHLQLPPNERADRRAGAA